MADNGDDERVGNVSKIAPPHFDTGLPHVPRAGNEIIGEIEGIFYQQQTGQAEQIDDQKLIDALMKH